MSAGAPWDEVLDFWLGPARRDPGAVAARSDFWFRTSPETDAAVCRALGPWHARAASGELDAWSEAPEGRLALVVLLDQVPRNLHRGSAEAFAWDGRALALTLEALDRGLDAPLTPVERLFLVLPLEHAEDAGHQAHCVAYLESLLDGCEPAWRTALEGWLDYARRHQAVIQRFGRFPYRNAVLGRPSTPEEERWLEAGERFGQ